MKSFKQKAADKFDERIVDRKWRLNHLYHIKDKNTDEKVLLPPNKVQQHFDKNKHYRNIILKSRQHGFTTWECADSLDEMMFNKGTDVALFSYDEESAIDIFDYKVDFMWRNIPDQLKNLYILETDRANKIKLGFGDKNFSTFSVLYKASSRTFSRVHISEYGTIAQANPQRAKDLKSDIIPAVPFEGRVDIESTAEGSDDAFAEMFWEAWNRGEPESRTDFKAHFYNWQWDKTAINKYEVMDVNTLPDYFQEYQIKHRLTDQEITYYWRKLNSFPGSWKSNLTIMKKQYPTTPEEAFETAGDKVFPIDRLKNMEEKTKEPRRNGAWRIYEDYDSTESYIIASDVSEGIGRDHSTIVVLKVSTDPMEVVAVFSSDSIKPDELAYELRDVGRGYGYSTIAVENNNHGYATITKLKGMYNNLYTQEKDNRRGKKKRTEKLGWSTTRSTKPKMIYDLKSLISQGAIKVPDRGLVIEMKMYDEDEVKKVHPDEDQTKHFDTLMALAIAVQARDQARTSGRVNSEQPGDRGFDKYSVV